MKTFKVLDKKTGNLLIKCTCYDKKIYKHMLATFRKQCKFLNIIEEVE